MSGAESYPPFPEMDEPMSDPLAYVNGQLAPAAEAAVSVFDRGLRWGDACYDVERSFGHKIFRLRDHMERLYRSLRYCRIPEPMTVDEMEHATLDLFERNVALVDPEDDLEVCQVVTRGTMQDPNTPTVIIYTRPLDFAAIHRRLCGVRLYTVSTRRVPPECLCSGAKITNKMGFHVANAEAQARDPEGHSVLLDLHGHVTESSNCNLFFAKSGTLFTPSLQFCLPGISRAVTLELARELGIDAEEGVYTIFDFLNADEIMLTGTTVSFSHATHLDGVRIGDKAPGEITLRFRQAWCDLVGVDFVGQARKRGTTSE